MEPYVFLFICVLIMLFFKSTGTDVRICNFSILDFIVFGLFFGFYVVRYEIGFDYNTYISLISNQWYDAFYEVKNEIFSYCLMDIAYRLNNPHIFFVEIAAIALPLYFYSYSKYSKSIDGLAWGLMVFMALPIGFMYSLSISRQFAASAIILWGTRYLFSRNFFKYSICIVAASLFHISSMLMIILYVSTFRIVKIRLLIIICMLSPFIFFGVKQIIIAMFPFFESYLKMTLGEQNDGVKQVVLYILLGCVFLGFYKRNMKKIRYELFLKLYIIGLILCCSFIPFSPNIGGRIGLSGLMYSCYLLPYVPASINNHYLRLVTKISLVIVLMMLYLYGLLITEDSYLPYKMIL